MDLIFTKCEIDIFRKLEKLKRKLTGRSSKDYRIENLIIKYHILNYFARLNINPTPDQFDAITDEIEGYLDKSIKAFAAFLGDEDPANERP